jgi:hypothetical protein
LENFKIKKGENNMKNLVIRLLCLALFVSAVSFAMAQKSRSKVPAGNDRWITDSAATGELLSVPENFFGEGSLPFTGFIHYAGNPRSGVKYDTNIRREQDVNVPGTTSLRVMELYMKSVAPVEVSFRDGTSSPCEIFVELSPSIPSKGMMTITKTSWSSNLTVVPSYTFKCDRTNVFGGTTTVTRDMGTKFFQAFLKEKARSSQQNLFEGRGTNVDEFFAGLSPKDESGVYGAQFGSSNNTWKMEKGVFQTTTQRETTGNSALPCDPSNCRTSFEFGQWICHCTMISVQPDIQIE